MGSDWFTALCYTEDIHKEDHAQVSFPLKKPAFDYEVGGDRAIVAVEF